MIATLQIGSPRRTRTADPVINSHLLYRLSYRGTVASRASYRWPPRASTAMQRPPGPGRPLRDAQRRTSAIAAATVGRLVVFSAATQMRPVPTA